MSLESAKAFVERMQNDEDFRQKVTECEDSELRKELVQKEGFDFSVQELKECTKELSDEELDSVAGGKYCNYGGLDWHMNGPFDTCG